MHSIVDRLNLNILKVKGYNLIVIILIVAQLIMLMSTTILFVYSMAESSLKITSVIGFVGLLFICFPIVIYLYLTSKDKTIKNIFLCLLVMISLNTLSGVLWFIIPATLNLAILIPLAKLLMVAGYLPLTYLLLDTFINQKSQLHGIIKILICYVNGTFILTILYLIATQISTYQGNNFDVVIYTAVSICDVLILSFSTALFLINIPTQQRYIYSILFIFYSISFIGDTFQLINFMNLYDLYNYSEIIYDIMFLFLAGALIAYMLSNIKLTTVEEMNKKLRDTTLVVEDLITQSPEPTCMCDAQGNMLKANTAFLQILDLPEKDHKNINIFTYDFLTDTDLTTRFQEVKRGATVTIDSVPIRREDEYRHLALKLYPTYSSDGKITTYMLLGEDITERKNAYELLEKKVKERTSELSILNDALQTEIREHKIDEEKIKSSLKEKEVLLKEIHHRVKNNMQVISSMLELQTAYVHDSQLNEIIKDCQNRIKSMALIHEKLYQSDNLAYVDFSEYIHSLVGYLTISFGQRDERIKIITEVDNISFNIDTAIPIGLLLNELISNSLKHAFPGDSSGEITIKIRDAGLGQYVITVKDNGIGFPENFDINNLKTLGLNLVNVLIDQINGTLTIEKDCGAHFTIAFNYGK